MILSKLMAGLIAGFLLTASAMAQLTMTGAGATFPYPM